MSKNKKTVQKPSKGSAKRDEWLPSCTRDASANELMNWLKHPPTPEAHRIWNVKPWPLKRALELERIDVFEAWYENGCSIGGMIEDKDFINAIGDNKDLLMNWLLTINPNKVEQMVDGWRRNTAQPFPKLDWEKILNHPNMSEKLARKLASQSLLGKQAFPPIDIALNRVNGKIEDENKCDTYFDEYFGRRRFIGFHKTARMDSTTLDRIKKLPKTITVNIQPGWLASNGMLLSAAEAIRRGWGDQTIQYASPSYENMFSEWNKAFIGLSEEKLEDELDLVINTINWKRKDNLQRTALHAVALKQWPEQLVEKVLCAILDEDEHILTQKDKNGKTPAQSEINTDHVNKFLQARELMVKLNKVLKHQRKGGPMIIKPPSKPRM